MNSIFPDTSNDFRNLICSALKNALEIEMPEIMEEHNIEDRNCYGQFRWNVIMSNLKGKCRFYGACQRRAWRFPVVYYPERDYLITFMTEERLREIQRESNKAMHYLCAASCWNKDVAVQQEQLRFELPIADIDDSWIEQSQTQMAECVNINPDEVKGHVLIVFSCKLDQITSVRAVRLTSNLDISTEEEDWTMFLDEPFAETNTVLQPQTNIDEEELLVELK